MLQSNLLTPSMRRRDAQRLEPRRHAECAARDECDAHAPVPRRKVRAVHLTADFFPTAPVAADGETVEVAASHGHAKVHDWAARRAFTLVGCQGRLARSEERRVGKEW